MMPQGSLITSALSNKGNATGYGQDNTFRVLDQQAIRMFDDKGNLLFSGVGPEAAKQAVALGQNLSDTLGRKADWTIQTGSNYTNTDGTTGTLWSDVAHEKSNLSTLGKIGKVVGTALPLAVSLIPGLQVLGPVLSSVAAGGAGAAMAGRDPLKGALTAGLTAGGGEFLGPILNGAGIGLDAARAIGTGIGATTGGLATGQSLTDALKGGVISGGLNYVGGKVFGPSQDDIINQNVSNAMGRLDNSIIDMGYGAPALLDVAYEGQGAFSPDGAVPAPSVNSTPPSYPTTSVSSGVDPAMVVTGTRLSGPTFSGGSNFIPSARYSGDGPTPSDYTVTARETAQEQATSPLAVPVATTTGPDTVVTGAREPVTEQATSPLAVPVATTTGPDTVVTGARDVPALNEDKPLAVNLDVGSTLATVDNNPDITKGKDGLTTKQKLELAALLASLLGGGGGGSGGGGGTVPSGLSRLTSPVFDQTLSVLTPEQNRAKYGARNMTGTDWATWGSRPATSFFQNVQQQPTGMAHGGSLAAKRGGRSSFAVNGPGTGRSDDIPAVLSDGEYVIDAETVALLGDGSSKAGAKKLDDLRVKVRKHKGKKLALGRFSANAKSPEAYLSGGRT
jgi:hypothetical protein